MSSLSGCGGWPGGPRVPGFCAAPGNTTNEIVLVTIAGGAHFWPEADSPWDASVEVLKFFEAH